MAQTDKINITGKNFLIAILIALFATIILTSIYTLMALIVAKSDGTYNSISAVEWIIGRFFLLFKMIGFCVVPVFSYRLLLYYNVFELKTNQLEKEKK